MSRPLYGHTHIHAYIPLVNSQTYTHIHSRAHTHTHTHICSHIELSPYNTVTGFITVLWIYIYIYIYIYIGPAVTVFAKGLGDRGSIPSRVIPKIQEMVLDASLLKPHNYKVWIKSKVEQSRERSSVLPYTSV